MHWTAVIVALPAGLVAGLVIRRVLRQPQEPAIGPGDDGYMRNIHAITGNFRAPANIRAYRTTIGNGPTPRLDQTGTE